MSREARIDKLVEESAAIFNDPALDAKRFAANVKLIQIVTEYLLEHPQERFGQALRNLGITVDSTLPDGDIYWCNGFYEEPTETLKRVEQNILDAQEAEKRGG